MQKREVFLLKWLVDLDSNDENVWQTFYDWILSPHINNISKNDINVTDVLFLTNVCIQFNTYAALGNSLFFLDNN